MCLTTTKETALAPFNLAHPVGSDVDFQLSQVSVATYCRCGGNLCGVYCIHREFSCESIGERIL